MTRLLIALLLVIPLGAAAQNVYKSIDENGNTVFSDTPPANASEIKNIQVGPTNSTPPPPDMPRPPAPETQEELLEVTVEITSPAPETTIAVGYGGNFSVSATTNAPLASGATAQLLMDGVPVGGSGSILAWSLTNVFRGEHILTVSITGADGEQLAISPPLTVYVRRASARH